ncbi:CLUMA_CG015516, isoform A [Clunio marinus]|uniref:CLUMA_CG015516, isoform A n=1 Tax=Clunio marinus TaxID=568069 RepID=A0A1J1IRF7_9DIPT|nr:CLUMA_CG015516, isoform A [Clunio marinus]
MAQAFKAVRNLAPSTKMSRIKPHKYGDSSLKGILLRNHNKACLHFYRKLFFDYLLCDYLGIERFLTNYSQRFRQLLLSESE